LERSVLKLGKFLTAADKTNRNSILPLPRPLFLKILFIYLFIVASRKL